MSGLRAGTGVRLFLLGVGATLASVAGLFAASACGGFESGATTELVGPSFAQFEGILPDGGTGVGVCQVLEKRCGTLDCHGQIARPLRIYGQDSLRLTDGGSEDAENAPGVEPTTPAEYLADYEAVTGLQPELMTEVVQGTQPPQALLLLRKPLQLERHKGGQVIVENDPAYDCIVSWLTTSLDAGGINYAACASANQ